MTSPRQRKKRLAIKKLKEKLEQGSAVVEHKPVVVQKQVSQEVTEAQKPVAPPSQAVVDSEAAAKQKKPKIGLSDTKPQVQVVQQPKEEVKTEIVEAKKEIATKE